MAFQSDLKIMEMFESVRSDAEGLSQIYKCALLCLHFIYAYYYSPIMHLEVQA